MSKIENLNIEKIQNALKNFSIEDKSYDDMLIEISQSVNTDNYPNIKPQGLIKPTYNLDIEITEFRNKLTETLNAISTFIKKIDEVDNTQKSYTYQNNSDNSNNYQNSETTGNQNDTFGDIIDVNTNQPTNNNNQNTEQNNTANNNKSNNNSNTSATIINPTTPNYNFQEQTNASNNNTSSNTERFGTVVITVNNAAICDQDGNVIDATIKGEYQVYDVKTDENGNIIAVRISPDGETEKWIYLSQNNATIGQYIDIGQTGIYNTNGPINVYDAQGNLIGTLNGGKYNVYETKTDQYGNITSVRISPDGEEERWLNIYENNQNIGEYIPNGYQNGTTFEVNNNKGKLTLFSGKTKILGGILGLLIVSLGSTMYLKKKNGEKIKDEVAEGEYNVYDIETDENGNITDAQITNNEQNEYWVHF